jgi:hypothetical protein
LSSAASSPEPAASLELQLALDDLWAVKNALMGMRDSTELLPDKERWIANKVTDLRMRAAAIRAKASAEKGESDAS